MNIMDIMTPFLNIINSGVFWDSAQFFVLTISLILIFYQVRLQRYTHLVTTLQTLDDFWNSDAMLTARKQYCQLWLQGKKEPTPIGEFISEFFEQLAIYEKMKAIPASFLWETYSIYIENYYPILKNQLSDIRKKTNDSSLYEGFDKLYESMIRLTKKKRINTNKEENDFINFCIREIRISDLSFSLGAKENSGRKKLPQSIKKRKMS